MKNFEKSPVGKAITQFAALPAEGVNAVLGAPQRAVASGIGNAKENPAGTAELALPPPLSIPAAIVRPEARKAAGNAIYAAFHPNDPSIQEKAEKATGVNENPKH